MINRLFILLISTGVVLYFCTSTVTVGAQELSQQAEEQLDFANGLYGRGLYKMAVQEYQNFIDKFPESDLKDKAYFGMAESYFFMDDHEHAQEVYHIVLTNFPQSPLGHSAQLRIAQIHFAAKKYQEATETISRVQFDQLDNKLRQTFLFYQGRILFELNQFESAVASFEKAEQIKDSDEYTTQSLIYKGEAFAEAGKYDQALASFQQALKGKLNEEEKARAQYKIGETQFIQGRYNEAAASFKDFLSVFSQHPFKNQALANLMSAYFNLEDFKAIEETFKEAAGRDPLVRLDHQIMYVLSNSYMRQLQLMKALEAINFALEAKDISPDERIAALFKKVEILI